ncbi:MAG: carbohydrate kinase family protein [Phycisphaerales bacterium]|nr:carbohydrate kinase family protein [Phycisphaerales bacterium]
MSEILVCGISVVDAIARPIDAFPAPGGLRLFDSLNWSTGGCAVNCSIAMARLGTPPRLVTRVGADFLGDFVISELSRHGVDTSGVVRDASKPTSFSFVAVPTGGERSFIHTKGASDTLRESDVPDSLLRASRFVFVTGAMLMNSLDGEPTARLFARAKAAGAFTLLDTVYVEGLDRDQWRRRIEPALRHVDYFIPSEAEARAIAGTPDPSAAAREFRSLGAQSVVVKLGARGVLCLDSAGIETIVPAVKVDHVVDATGAGDCWSAGFIAGLSRGRSFTDAARIGNAVAALSVQAAGATAGLEDPERLSRVFSGDTRVDVR